MLGVKIITIATAILQILSLGHICISCHIILNLVKQSQIQAGSFDNLGSHVYGQIVGLIVSHLLGWIPASCVFVTLLFLPTWPTHLIDWTIISGVSINCLVTPVIFLVMKANKGKDVGHTCKI